MNFLCIIGSITSQLNRLILLETKNQGYTYRVRQKMQKVNWLSIFPMIFFWRTLYMYFVFCIYANFFKEKTLKGRKRKGFRHWYQRKNVAEKSWREWEERKRIGHTWKVACTANTRNRRTQIQFSANSSFLVLAGRHFGVAI